MVVNDGRGDWARLMQIGVDVGGTKIEAVVMTGEGEVCWRERVATPQGSYLETVKVISQLVNKAKQETGLSCGHAVGIGTPGALYMPKGGTEACVKNANSTALNGQPLLKDLQQALKCPVRIENDANCFALAEALSGQGTGGQEAVESVFGVILGTGVGGGLVMQNKLLSGRHRIAGEWGHNPLPASQLAYLSDAEKKRPCYCGKYDCIETYVSGPGLALSFSLKYQEDKDSKDILKLVRQQNEAALLVWDNYLDQLAASLAQVVNILDPQIIVLGGGMSLIAEIYQTLAQRMAPYVFTHDFSTPILPAKLGDSAGVYGAAWLST